MVGDRAPCRLQSRGNQEAIKRPCRLQSRGNQEAIKRPCRLQSRGNQEAINDAPRSCALPAGQRAIRRIGLRRRRALGPARRSESRLMRRAISMHSEGISREASSVAISMQSACNQHAFRGDLKGGIIRGNQHAISMHSEGISREASSVAIRMQSACTQRGSQGRHHPWQSACNQRRSESGRCGFRRRPRHHIRGHHPSSEVIRGTHPSSEVITAVN